jgi:ribosomal protein S12 methylthiotransferase accessory factor YcaO
VGEILRYWDSELISRAKPFSRMSRGVNVPAQQQPALGGQAAHQGRGAADRAAELSKVMEQQ